MPTCQALTSEFHVQLNLCTLHVSVHVHGCPYICYCNFGQQTLQTFYGILIRLIATCRDKRDNFWGWQRSLTPVHECGGALEPMCAWGRKCAPIKRQNRKSLYKYMHTHVYASTKKSMYVRTSGQHAGLKIAKPFLSFATFVLKLQHQVNQLVNLYPTLEHTCDINPHFFMNAIMRILPPTSQSSFRR